MSGHSWAWGRQRWLPYVLEDWETTRHVAEHFSRQEFEAKATVLRWGLYCVRGVLRGEILRGRGRIIILVREGVTFLSYDIDVSPHYFSVCTVYA